jgi:hypothetical protein
LCTASGIQLNCRFDASACASGLGLDLELLKVCPLMTGLVSEMRRVMWLRPLS